MKSLKPVKSNNTSPTLIAENVVAEMRAGLDVVNNAIVNINNQIADINAQLDTDAVNETSGTFDTLNTRNANISNKLNVTDEITARKVKATVGVETPRVDADVVSVNSVSADTVSANQGNFDNLAVSQCITTPTANITDANITNLSSTNVNLENIATQSINTPAAEVGTLRVQNLQNVAEFSSSVVNANREVNAPQVNTAEANITNLQVNMAKMDALFTQNIEFNTDENDVTQYVVLDPPVDSSSGNNDPVFIEMPAIASGFYRINIKKQNGKYFAVTLINTESTPIVQYDKDEDADIDYLFYDTITNKLYVKTFAAGKIFWANDSKRTAIAPKTYAELPIDPSLETTLKYRAGGKRRVVIMGNNQLDYGLAVQGVLEATMIKENAAYHQLFYYGDSFEALEFLCDKYLKYEDPLDHSLHYTTSETAGYLRHMDSNYRDPGNITLETEAIEKISYDGTKVVLTLDTRHGQDEIELYEEEGVGPVEIIHSSQSSDTYVPVMISQIEGYTGKTIAQLISEYYVEGTRTPIFELNLDVPENHNYGRLSVFTDFSTTENEPVIVYHYDTHRVNGDNEGHGFWSSGILANGTQARYGGGYMDSVLWTGMDANGKMPMPNPLPFVMSFTMSTIAWDKLMNEEIFNSWGMDRS